MGGKVRAVVPRTQELQFGDHRSRHATEIIINKIIKYSHNNSRAGWWIAGGVVLVAVGLIAWGNHSASTLTTRQLALSCTTDLLTTFHIHPHLTIVINGATQTIPADIGISLTCMHPIHTHAATGKIHIESPVPRDFTLGDFFAVWGKTFNQNQILDSGVDASHTITVTVNGSPVDTYENTVLHDGDQIIISYGAKT